MCARRFPLQVRPNGSAKCATANPGLIAPNGMRGGSARSSSFGLSGATFTYTKMATTGAPVDWTGSCKSSDKGVLIPAGKVECGWAPAPQHDPAPPDTCPTGTMTKLENFKFMAKYF